MKANGGSAHVSRHHMERSHHIGLVSSYSKASLSRLALLRMMSLCGALFAAIVILAGAWTRLLDAGLGCPDWPGCYGALVVPGQDVANLHSPDVAFEASKAWMEMIHRYLAMTLGILVVALVLLSWRLRHLRDFPWRLIVGMLLLMMVQGAFGAFTVTLKLWPQVVTLHLLGGLAVMTAFLWLYLRLRGVSRGQRRLVRRPVGVLWKLAGAVLVLQLALGGWTSSNYAGIACYGVPTCNAQWWPETDWGEGFHLTQNVGPNYLYGQLHAEARTTIHFAHRLGAAALAVLLMVLIVRHWRESEIRPWLASLGAALVLQAGLGAANVVLWLPPGLALMHTAGAILLVFSFVLVCWKRRYTEVASPRKPLTRPEDWLYA